MKCPNCSYELEKEDASVDGSLNKEWIGGEKGKIIERKIVSVIYYCPPCGEYWQWWKGSRLIQRPTGGKA